MNYLKPLLPFLIGWGVLIWGTEWSELAAVNGLAQLLLFAFVVCLPAWRTGRLSYVDIGWPVGLAVIGALTIALGEGDPVRVGFIGGIFLCIGLRMAVAALSLWRNGHLQKELPRYQYQRLRWQRKGITNEPLMIQVEALVQGLANASYLALPAFIIASNPTAQIHPLEVIALLIWVGAFVMETVADKQKHRFLVAMKQQGLRKQVCNVGLWRYSRHPNYFAEWMVWNALVIGAIPSWLALQTELPLPIWLLLAVGLLLTTRMMYVTLVHYTGAKPAEYYSVQKRPGYREYQLQTNRFFPGPSRDVSDVAQQKRSV